MTIIRIEMKDGSEKIIKTDMTFQQRIRLINETQSISDDLGNPIDLKAVKHLHRME